jgi:hypothetical protein
MNTYRDIIKNYKNFSEINMNGNILMGVKDDFQISVMINDNTMTENKDKTSVTIGVTPYTE